MRLKLKLKKVCCDVCGGSNLNEYGDECESCDQGYIYQMLNWEEFVAAQKSMKTPKPTPKREPIRTQSSLPTISPSPTPPPEKKP